MTAARIMSALLVSATATAAVAACTKHDAEPSVAASAAPSSSASSVEGEGYAGLERQYAELDQAYASAPDPQALGDWRQRMASIHLQMGAVQHLGATRPRKPRGMMGGGMGMMGSRRAGRMMGGGSGMMTQRACAMDDWNRQMASLNREAAAQARKAGDEKLAGRHEAIAAEHEQLARDIDKGEASPQHADTGRAIYAQSCAPCHGARGQGVAGAFPPLAGSDVVTGPADRLVRIVLGGVTGPLRVGDHTYYGAMPGFATRLDDTGVAAVSTAIRSSWGNSASAIAPAQVTAMRKP